MVLSPEDSDENGSEYPDDQDASRDRVKAVEVMIGHR
jgi:hypothetical protein